MSNNKKYWYFRFCENCFSDEKMRNMKHIPMIGDTFIVIFFELCALSIRNNGYIRVPEYQAEKYYLVDLAKDIGRNVDTLSNAVTYYIENGLVEVYDADGCKIIYIPFVENNVGKSSSNADIKRLKYREENNILDSPYGKLEESNDKTLFLNDGVGLEIKENIYGEFKNVFLNEEDYKAFINTYSNAKTIIGRLSVDKKLMGLKVKDDYKYLMEILGKEGIKK